MYLVRISSFRKVLCDIFFAGFYRTNGLNLKAILQLIRMYLTDLLIYGLDVVRITPFCRNLSK